MARTMMSVCALLAIGLLVGSVQAEVISTLEYVGAFRVSSGYYEASMAFVPGGTNADRPGGLEINVPTLLTASYGHATNDPLKEWYIPADASLAKLSTDTAPAATQVTQAEGGTYVENCHSFETGFTSGISLLNGRMYGVKGASGSGIMVGEMKMGHWDAAWPADFVYQFPPKPGGTHSVQSGGIATKYDEADTLIYVAYNSGGNRVFVHTTVKGAPSATPGDFDWTSTNQFYFDTATTNEYAWPIAYANFRGTGYYILYNSDPDYGHAGEATLDFYDASVFTGGVDATSGPSFSLNIDDLIEAGFDWNIATAILEDMAYDPATERLYVIENNRNGGRSGNQIATIHVIQLVPEPATMGLLGLGFAGMAALRRRRRK